MVGSHLITFLLSKNYKVIAGKRAGSNTQMVEKVAKWRYSDHPNLLENLKWIDTDLYDYIQLIDLLEGIDYVVHCAAIVSFNPSDKDEMIRNNTQTTANIVDAAIQAKVKKFCHVSSVAALGQTRGKDVVNEKSLRSQNKGKSGYSISKFNSEMEVWRGINNGLNAVIVNPSVIIGPGDWSKNSQQMFPMLKKGMKYYTPGITGFVDVMDVVQIISSLLESDISSERFCLNSENLSYKELFGLIATSVNAKAPNKQVKPWMLQIAWRFEKVKSLLFNSSPKISKETAKSAFSMTNYSNQKTVKKLNWSFIPIKESITKTGQFFLEDTNSFS